MKTSASLGARRRGRVPREDPPASAEMSAVDRLDPDASGIAHGQPPRSGWSQAACLRASGTLGTVEFFTGSFTGDVLLQIHERDADGAHLVEAAIRLDKKALRALVLLLEREVAR